MRPSRRPVRCAARPPRASWYPRWAHPAWAPEQAPRRAVARSSFPDRAGLSALARGFVVRQFGSGSGLRRVRDGVLLTEPGAQIDESATLAAEGPERRLCGPFDLPAAGRALDGVSAHAYL